MLYCATMGLIARSTNNEHLVWSVHTQSPIRGARCALFIASLSLKECHRRKRQSQWTRSIPEPVTTVAHTGQVPGAKNIRASWLNLYGSDSLVDDFLSEQQHYLGGWHASLPAASMGSIEDERHRHPLPKPRVGFRLT